MLELFIFVFVTAVLLLIGLFAIASEKPAVPAHRLRRIADGPNRSRLARGRM
jgi:hypothetical protein